MRLNPYPQDNIWIKRVFDGYKGGPDPYKAIQMMATGGVKVVCGTTLSSGHQLLLTDTPFCPKNSVTSDSQDSSSSETKPSPNVSQSQTDMDADRTPPDVTPQVDHVNTVQEVSSV